MGLVVANSARVRRPSPSASAALNRFEVRTAHSSKLKRLLWSVSSARKAAARGARVVVHEKGGRAGGSMLLSSGVVWRHRELDDFLRECPGGTVELQRLVHERLDDDLAWLESLGARCRVTMTEEPVSGLGRLGRNPLGDALLRRRNTEALARLRAICERRTEPSE